MANKKAGRPKSNLDLPDGWQTKILSLYREGASNIEIKAQIHEWRGSFSNDLWERWCKEEEEFSQVINVGKMLSEAWWSKSGRTNLVNKEFNYTGWYMNMKNRFGWSDKLKTDNNNQNTVTFNFDLGNDDD